MHLKKLLDSTVDQTYKDYEVIITDDSPDFSVKELCQTYEQLLPLKYIRNPHPLGTPENWNEAIRNATGKWIKIMHDDDWFLTNDALSEFAQKAEQAAGTFIFSAFQNVRSADNSKEIILLDNFRYSQLIKNPVSIISKNCIGPPSVTLFEREPFLAFDNRMKWLVDMDFYIRILTSRKPLYINKPLIGIGIHETQVTVSSSLNPSVEIPEHLLLLEKTGVRSLNNILFYDAYWRLFRNLKINSPEQLATYAVGTVLPSRLVAMLDFQRKCPAGLLSVGVASKLLMAVSYLKNLWSKT